MNAQQKSLDFLGIQAKILGLQRYLVMRLRESRLNVKLFVEFVALIYLAYINRKMQEHGLYKD